LAISLASISGKIRHVIVEGRVLEKPTETQKLTEYCQSSSMTHSVMLGMVALCIFWIVLLIGTAIASQQEPSGLIKTGWLLFVAISLSLSQFSSRAFKNTLQLSHALSGFQNLLRQFENLAFSPQALGSWPLLAKKTMSGELKKLDRWASFLSVEAHPIIYLVLNALTPWSAFFGVLLELERRSISKTSSLTFEELHELEIIGCLALSYKYRSKVFPQFSEVHENLLQTEAAFHPLIDRKHVIQNDFAFVGKKNLGLITGSNMSGKSTFLRTIGVNQTLALIGAPVFAKKWSSVLAAIESCIQVSDSLNDGFSYFYSEVLRLKNVLEECQKKKCLYLVDEIFKGTNNRERLIGSEALLTALSKTPSFGFVTTHDLELTTLEQKFPNVCNFHFRDEVKDGKMSFPYKIFNGPCTTTNALKIMAQEGLPVPV
ncbi:MAG: DNA mismatch repair protein MutS, partial [Pseudobdellovibrionaceae bacterium]